jgi:hypothetical protein
MISLIQASLRYLFTATLNPQRWTIEEPQGVKGIGQPTQSGRWSRVMVEVPLLQSKMMKIDSQTCQSQSTLQYRCVLRFPGNLTYDQLPMKKLVDMGQYLTFVMQSHPSLLSSSPEQINRLLNWEYPHVDRCLYPDDTPISDIEKALADLTVNKIEVNHFIPIMEMDGTDWLVIMVWSIQVQYEVGMTTIRQYWIDALDPNQITANPTLTGGELDRQPWQIGLVVRKKKLGDQTDPPVFQPIPGQIEHQ